MPRHPPCALTHLTTTRCSHPLCNTQHTTTPRTPHPPPHKHNPERSRHALDRPDQERHQENPASRCLLRTQQRAKPPTTTSSRKIRTRATCVPPSHTHTPPATTDTMPDQMRNSERRPEPVSPTTPQGLRPATRVEHTLNMRAP